MELDPAKIKAIREMTRPKDKNDLQSFLGMVNYLSRFTPHLAALTAPLRDLTKKDSMFGWGPEHDKAFKAIKTEITSVSRRGTKIPRSLSPFR